MYLLELIKLLRPQQWYKNLLVFAALFFSGQFFNTDLLLLSILGFMALSLISSGSYIINDIIDYKRDKKNPEKKTRPIASGKISRFSAMIYAIIVYVLGFGLSIYLSKMFLLVGLSIAILTFIYSIWLKNIVFADITAISTNFILRALAGVVLINVILSPWFFLGILCLAFFLVAGKRHGDLSFLGNKAKDYKKVLQYYDVQLLEGMIQIFLGLLLIIYGLYAHFSNHLLLYLLYPLLIFILFRYYYLIHKKDSRVRNPERMITDAQLLITSVIFMMGVAIIIGVL